MKTLYTADYVLTLDPGNTVVADGALLVDGTVITAVGPAADLVPRARRDGAAVRALADRLLMPGLVKLAQADLAELIDRARALVPGLFQRRAEYLAAQADSAPAVTAAKDKDV